MTPAGLITLTSRHGPKDTMDRLVAALEGRGMSVFARIDHAAAAHAAGLELRPTEVLVFGNPRAGTLLMQAAQTIGIDLPLKPNFPTVALSASRKWRNSAALPWVR